LTKICLKTRIFEKTVKISRWTPFSAGGWELRPQTPELLLPPAITTLYSSILTHKMRIIAPQGSKNNYSKCSAFPSFALFAPIFRFKLRSFC